MCLTIARKGGRITPDDYARVWVEDLNPDRLFYTERIALEKLKLGMSPWHTGRGQLPSDAAMMSIAPVGIINAGDPTQAYQDAFNVASIHQDGIERARGLDWRIHNLALTPVRELPQEDERSAKEPMG